jgi:hypothetical protein
LVATALLARSVLLLFLQHFGLPRRNGFANLGRNSLVLFGHRSLSSGLVQQSLLQLEAFSAGTSSRNVILA